MGIVGIVMERKIWKSVSGGAESKLRREDV